MGIIFGLLKQFWPQLLIGLLVLAVVLYWKGLQHEIESLQKDKVTLQETVKDRTAERDQWITNYGTLKEGLTVNNTLLQGLAGKTDGLKKDLAKIQGTVNTTATTLGTQLSLINKLDLSKLTDKEAIQHLRDAAQGKLK